MDITGNILLQYKCACVFHYSRLSEPGKNESLKMIQKLLIIISQLFPFGLLRSWIICCFSL